MAKGDLNPPINAQEELKKIRAEKRKLIKREKELKGQKKALKDIDKFKELLKLKEEIREIHSKAYARAEELVKSKGVSLTSLSKLKTKTYLYQHPTRRTLKADDKSVPWVRDALNGVGGNKWTLEDLENTALNSQLRSFNRAKSRKGKKATKRASDKPNEKTSVIGSRGIR